VKDDGHCGSVVIMGCCYMQSYSNVPIVITVDMRITPNALLSLSQIKSNQIKFICDKNKHNVTHEKQSRYVDRTQRHHALTSALKIKTLQQKFKFDNSTLEAGYSRRSNNIIRKGVPCINYTITEKMTVSIRINMTFVQFHAITSSVTYDRAFNKWLCYRRGTARRACQ